MVSLVRPFSFKSSSKQSCTRVSIGFFVEVDRGNFANPLAGKETGGIDKPSPRPVDPITTKNRLRVIAHLEGNNAKSEIFMSIVRF